MKRPVSLTVNGRSIETTVEPRMHLADFVRDRLRLTGTHLGCEHGVCGACTVLIDGVPMRSCIAYAVACDSADVRTIEGFDGDPLMQALRDAFTCHHALQCGYCTPGMLITAYDIIRRLPGADEARVREELSGNLCRCTGYVGIVQAVRSVLADPHPSTPLRDSGSGGRAEDSTSRSFNPPPRDDVAPQALQAPVARHGTRDAPRVGSPGAPPGTSASPAVPTPHATAAPEAAESEHAITLTVPPDTLWSNLQDITTVVRCLPGASLTGPATADPLSLRMTVAIGPMQARFDGAARVAFDDRERTALIEGKGHDARSRSTSEGHIRLLVRPSGAHGSVLTLRLHYVLKGPLAQFGRATVVNAIVEQLLGRFAANLAEATSGVEMESAEVPGVVRLGIATLWRRLRRWLSGDN